MQLDFTMCGVILIRNKSCNLGMGHAENGNTHTRAIVKLLISCSIEAVQWVTSLQPHLPRVWAWVPSNSLIRQLHHTFVSILLINLSIFSFIQIYTSFFSFFFLIWRHSGTNNNYIAWAFVGGIGRI